MADSLDDFFAKKDKKRGKDKTKTSALSAEALVRELEEGAKQSDYPIRNKPSAAIEILGLDSNDADWKDFEEVEKRDYTGLKVKEMSIQDQNDEEQKQPEPVPESTPWKMKDDNSSAKANAAATVAAAAEAAKQNQDTNNPSTPSTTNPSEAATATTTTTPASSTTTSDTNKTVSDNDGTNQKDGLQKDATGNSEASSAEAPKKESDIKKPSAKQAYVPPQERSGGSSEVNVLEPVKLSNLKKANSSRPGKTPDIQDVNAFPSLG